MKKGFTLIELILSLGILSIIIVLSLNFLIRDVSYYKRVVSSSKNHFYINEAIFFIENEIKYNNESIDVLNNTIIIFKKENKNRKRILQQNNKIVLITEKLYGETYYAEGNNNIIKKISKFLVEKYKNTIYILIKSEDGEEYKRCFQIE